MRQVRDVRDPGSAQISDRLARSALRFSVAASPTGAVLLVVAGLAVSWLLTFVMGGTRAVVPHLYYLPIVFAAVRFGTLPAVLVALASGLLAGPLTLMDVSLGIEQDLARWTTRAGFFLVVGIVMASLVRPSLPSITEEIRRRHDLKGLRDALERGELFLRYQPIIDLETGTLHGVEALLRWRHPEHGELLPAAFLPAAEASAFMHELGAWVFDDACTQAARWQRTATRLGCRPLHVAVNMSARELESPRLIQRVRDSLAASGIEPQLICIEITESALVDDLDVSAARLAGLKTLGVQLAVDDFGTGYSSLSAVHRFPIDIVKVDRSFIEPIGKDPGIEALLGGVVLFARSLELTTIAEGIETTKQARVITELGYPLGQGYHYGRPLTVDDIDALLTATPVPSLPGADVIHVPRSTTPGHR